MEMSKYNNSQRVIKKDIFFHLNTFKKKGQFSESHFGHNYSITYKFDM